MTKTILLIDDEPAIVESTKMLLEFAGYSVKTAQDGFGIQEHMHCTIPDLILLDYWLPRKNGGEITRELKENSRTKNIPVLIISASHNIREKIQLTGADGFLEKPFNMDELLTTVQKLL